jgi:hypothetical protein
MSTSLNHRRTCATVAFFFFVFAMMSMHDSSMAFAWVSPSTTTTTTATTRLFSTTKEKQSVPFFAAKQDVKEQSKKTTTTANNKTDSLEEATQKYGLEVGLFKSLQQKEGNLDSAKSLLKKYGIAYLATSIPLAILSFGLFYILVDQGVDVAALLQKVGIEQVSTTTSTAGTVAIAYAAHKAASPIRFPPTVILTPIVAKMIGKEPNTNTEEEGMAK